jgi:DDE family transposase
VKISTAFPRASHVNSDTSVEAAELPWPETSGRVMRHPKLHLEADPRGEMTELGGLVLPQQFVRRFRVAQRIDGALNLFKRRVPYHESDHVLALAYTLYADGTCLEDQATLQGSEAIRRMLGACRIPDPTTAGDFLRRFDKTDVATLADTMDDVQQDVWTSLSRRERRLRRKRELALVDLDGHIKEIYGSQKEGADFSYDGRWSYQPLVISLAGSGECLRAVNQPGNARSSDAAAGALGVVLPRVKRHFRNAVVRGDSDFDRSDVFNAVSEAGAYFAIVGRMHANRAALVRAIAEEDWKEFVPRAQREVSGVTSRRESSTPDYREKKVSEHGWKDLRTKGQWISEIGYHPAGVDEALRMIVRRVLIEEDDGQGTLFEHYRYRIILTSLPRRHTARQIVDLTYQRCDQENVIAEFGSGIAGWRMPVAQFWGNAAWLEIARLAWNLGK